MELKISPQKYQLFRKKLTYMVHTVFTENKVQCIAPLKTRLDGILKLDKMSSAQQCKQFCEMANYLLIFLKDLPRKLIPIHSLTRKDMSFQWCEEQ